MGMLETNERKLKALQRERDNLVELLDDIFDTGHIMKDTFLEAEVIALRILKALQQDTQQDTSDPDMKIEIQVKGLSHHMESYLIDKIITCIVDDFGVDREDVLIDGNEVRPDDTEV